VPAQRIKHPVLLCLPVVEQPIILPGPDPSVTTTDLLRAIRDAYPPALGTNDIAERIDQSQQVAHKHLSRLEDEQPPLVESMKVGRARIWWLTDAGRRRLSNQSSQ